MAQTTGQIKDISQVQGYTPVQPDQQPEPEEVVTPPANPSQPVDPGQDTVQDQMERPLDVQTDIKTPTEADSSGFMSSIAGYVSTLADLFTGDDEEDEFEGPDMTQWELRGTLTPDLGGGSPEAVAAADGQETYRSVFADILGDGGSEGRVDPTVEVQNLGETNPYSLAEAFIGKHEETHTNVLGNFFEKFAGQTIDPRKTAWCAAFVNAVLGKAGQEGTGKLSARSFLQWGEKTEDPSVGDIVVLWRGSRDDWRGHVGFFAGYAENGNIKILGGNQSNEVNVSEYKPNRLLGFRRAPRLNSPNQGDQRLLSLAMETN